MRTPQALSLPKLAFQRAVQLTAAINKVDRFPSDARVGVAGPRAGHKEKGKRKYCKFTAASRPGSAGCRGPRLLFFFFFSKDFCGSCAATDRGHCAITGPDQSVGFEKILYGCVLAVLLRAQNQPVSHQWEL